MSVVLAIVLVCAIVIQRCVVKRHKERKAGKYKTETTFHLAMAMWGYVGLCVAMQGNEGLCNAK